MDGVEIVIKPIHLERVIYSLVIITLAILLIIKWNGGGVAVSEEQATAGVIAEATTNETNQTTNASQEEILCSNGVKDQDETDIDCGGSKCDPCEEYMFCNVDSDCESGWCRANVKCIEPSCDDGVKNQDESNIDCGGKCGGYWYDGTCNEEPEPSYSGRIDLTILDVATSVTTFDNEDFAKIENVKFKVDNGKPEDVVLTAYLYARDEHGSAYFLRSVNDEEVPLAQVEIPMLKPWQSHTETVEVKRTLPETEPSENYQVVVELHDEDDKLVKKVTWTNE